MHLWELCSHAYSHRESVLPTLHQGAGMVGGHRLGMSEGPPCIRRQLLESVGPAIGVRGFIRIRPNGLTGGHRSLFARSEN